eukprot:CAMPEP_0119548552 /NCGR_PEP_ID=MMETSP1352-20130426/2446_1 /TAXON_ID=265584 /ORGANISM="Stauroneis constricta, Strain CCMP1120" /LENGTH=481 /DNA_ID=CAMNT_0007593859 /DNA_START=94 /DNA_END=1539 /DNA_ORIENTATION=-
MNVPIVQGVAVNNAGDAGNASSGAPSNTSTPYMSTSDGNIQQFSSASHVGGQEHPQQAGFQDPFWAVAFVVHLFIIGAIIVMNLGSVQIGGQSGYYGILWLGGIAAVVSVVLATLSLGFMMKFATELVKAALIFSVAMSGVMAVLMLLSGQMVMAILGLIMFGIGIWYAYAVWSRIPFAAANLKTALTAVRCNLGLTIVAYATIIFGVAWTMLWFIGASDYLSQENAIVMFLLLLSYYWVHQVLQNTNHVTVAGTIGTWWHFPIEASSGFCSPAIMDSFRRATTTSFGSICFGSFVLAFIQALRTTQRMIRDNDDCNILVCIIDLILGCLEAIIEYINKWAYVYVGLYGFNYLEAGRNVMQLFQAKGFTVIITDDLADNVLTMVSMGIGLCTGIITMLLALADRNLLLMITQDEYSPALPGFLIGFIAGWAFSSILMGIVASAVNTVIVCYAEAPAEFQENHPQLSAEMRAAWTGVYPELT